MNPRRRVLVAVIALAMATSVVPGSATSVTFILREQVQAAVPPLALTVSATSTPQLSLGGAVTFRNQGNLERTLHAEHSLFSWGPIEPGEELTFVPRAAGTYRFADEDSVLWEPGEGTFGVAADFPASRLVRGDPCDEGSELVVEYELRWALDEAPQGLVYDVQVKKYADPEQAWSWLHTGTTEPGATHRFTWTAPEIPTLDVRARVRHAEHPERVTGWSDRYPLPLVVSAPCPPERDERPKRRRPTRRTGP